MFVLQLASCVVEVASFPRLQCLHPHCISRSSPAPCVRYALAICQAYSTVPRRLKTEPRTGGGHEGRRGEERRGSRWMKIQYHKSRDTLFSFCGCSCRCRHSITTPTAVLCCAVLCSALLVYLATSQVPAMPAQCNLANQSCHRDRVPLPPFAAIHLSLYAVQLSRVCAAICGDCEAFGPSLAA